MFNLISYPVQAETVQPDESTSFFFSIFKLICADYSFIMTTGFNDIYRT